MKMYEVGWQNNEIRIFFFNTKVYLELLLSSSELKSHFLMGEISGGQKRGPSPTLGAGWSPLLPQAHPLSGCPQLPCWRAVSTVLSESPWSSIWGFLSRPHAFRGPEKALLSRDPARFWGWDRGSRVAWGP